LAEADARNVEIRPSLDDDDFDASLRECGGSRQAANAASDYQHTSNIAHRLAR
jgi:hypothetical protein